MGLEAVEVPTPRLRHGFAKINGTEAVAKMKPKARLNKTLILVTHLLESAFGLNLDSMLWTFSLVCLGNNLALHGRQQLN